MYCKHIILIDGAAGTGKSDLLGFVEQHIVGRGATIIKKFTTRERRERERKTNKNLDLKFISSDEFARYEKQPGFYSYRYPHAGGEKYGFFKADIELKLSQVDNVFLIVRSASTIKSILADFPDVHVIPVFVYTIESKVAGRLRADGYTDEEIRFRLSRTAEAMNDLYTHPALYKVHIINNSDRATYQRQLKEKFEELLAPCPSMLRISAREHYHLPGVLQPHKERMVAALRDHPFEGNVFVMMKFCESHEATFDVIQLAIESAGFRCVRADMNEWALTRDDVYNPFAVLYCCKYGIALFDEPEKDNVYNTNVAVELAMMHFQDKHCLMLKHRKLPPPPFDLAAKIYKEYDRPEELVAIISWWVRRLK